MRAIACYSATACFPIIVHKYPCNTPKCLQSAKTAGEKTFKLTFQAICLLKKTGFYLQNIFCGYKTVPVLTLLCSCSLVSSLITFHITKNVNDSDEMRGWWNESQYEFEHLQGHTWLPLHWTPFSLLPSTQPFELNNETQCPRKRLIVYQIKAKIECFPYMIESALCHCNMSICGF